MSDMEHGGYFGYVDYGAEVSGANYSMAADQYTVEQLTPTEATEESSIPEVIVSAPHINPNATALDAALGGLLTRQLGIAGTEVGLGIAEGMEAGAIAGSWAGPLGGLVGAAIGAGITYYMITHE